MRPVPDAAPVRADALRRERDELRASLAESMQQCRELSARLAEIEEQEPVAVVGETFSLRWASPGSMSEIALRHGIKVGSPLYARPAVPRVSR